MEYIKATLRDADAVYQLVQHTIQTVYPKYYPQEVVTFFCQLHSKEKIEKDIELGRVSILLDKNQIVGTGSRQENHITRVYVRPELQRQGYGGYIMQCLEEEIALEHSHVELDASLPACRIYEKEAIKP